MKNPIQLWKEPVRTVAQAEQKKKDIMPWLFISIGVIAVPTILNIFIESFIFSLFMVIGIFATLYFVFLLSIAQTAKKKFEALTCNKCNTMAAFETPEEFEKFVSYSVGKHEATYKGVSHPGTNNGVVSKIEAKGNASVVVSIKLKCPHCAEVKQLEYHIVPFKCSDVQEKVLVRDVELVKTRLENAVKEVVKDYNDPDKRANIPYSIHSKKNPNYANRNKVQVGNSWIPRYNGVRIDYRKDVEEMVEDFFINHQLDGTIIDPNKPKKSK